MHRAFRIVPSLLLLTGATALAEEAGTPVEQGERLVTVSDQEEPSQTGTKTDTDPLLQPQSIASVDADLIRERHAIKLEQVVQHVAGVTIGGYYGDWDYFRIRGFDAADSTRQDGLFAAPGYWISPDVYGFERIEVLKGPASMLYGRSSIGGLVNMVSKKPKAEHSVTGTVSAGDADFGELGVDANTTVAGDQVGLRLVGLARTRSSFVDGVDASRRLYIAPSLTWWAGDATTITLLGHYQKDSNNTPWPLPAAGFVTSNPNGDIPRERNIGEPGFQNHIDNRRAAAGYEIEHRFGEGIAVRQNARVTRVREIFQGIYPDLLEADDRTLQRTVYDSDSDYLIAQADTMLDLRLQTGPLHHEVLLGVDLMFERLNQLGGDATIDPIDVFDPVYGAEPSAFTQYSDARTESRTVGLYAQDQISVERLTVTGGVRWDVNKADDLERMTSATSDSEVRAATWRVGAAYRFLPVASVFSSYSTSFLPQPYSTDGNGDIVDPETGNQIEAGVRLRDEGGRLGATVAVFQITRRDVATEDLTTPGASVVTGEQRSRGIEFDGQADPLDGLSLLGTYAFIRAVVTEDNVLPVGDRLLNVPEHSATGWARYTLPRGAARGLGFGVGGRWYGSQSGDLPNTFDLPAYAVLDAALFFDRGAFSAQLNVDNLLDETYAIGSYDSLYVLPGDPLSIRGSVSYTF